MPHISYHALSDPQLFHTVTLLSVQTNMFDIEMGKELLAQSAFHFDAIPKSREKTVNKKHCS